MNIHKLNFQAGEIVERTFYCSNLNMNGLFQIDIESGKLLFIDYFKDNPIDTRNMHFGSFLYKDWIVFVPGNSKGIDLYNWKTKEFRCIYFNNKKGYWVNSILCGDIAWFIPADLSKPIFCLDLINFSTFTYQSPADYIGNTLKKGKMYRAAYLEGKIYAAIYRTRYIFCFCIETKKTEILDIDFTDLSLIDSGEDGLWILKEYGNEICHWKPNSGEKKILKCPVRSVIKEHERMASSILELKNDIYIFPGRMFADVMKYNKVKGMFEEVLQYPDDLIWNSKSDNYFWGNTSNDGIYYVYPFNANYIIVIDGEKNKFIKVGQINMNENVEILNSYLTSILNADIIEESRLSINYFLESIKTIQKKTYDIVNNGSQIYKIFIKNQK